MTCRKKKVGMGSGLFKQKEPAPVLEQAQVLAENVLELLVRDMNCSKAIEVVRQCADGVEACGAGARQFMKLLELIEKLADSNDQVLIDRFSRELETLVSNIQYSLGTPAFAIDLKALEQRIAKDMITPAQTKLLALGSRLETLKGQDRDETTISDLQYLINALFDEEPYSEQVDAIEDAVNLLEKSKARLT